MDDERPSIREWEEENWRRGHYGLVRPDWNWVTQNQRTNARDGQSRFNRVPKERERGRRICITTFNIRSGREGGLDMALRALWKCNIRIGVLQDTKIARGIHTQWRSGYNIWVTEAESQHQGRVAIV